MKTFFKTSLCGCSFEGSLHKQLHIKNQDAIKIKQYSFGSILAIADGVGSKKFSRYGSRAVVLAVHQAFLEYIKGSLERKFLTKRIGELFTHNLATKYIDEADTTCIFAAHIYGEGLFLGQYGDGLCCLRINDSFFMLKNQDTGFTNLVNALKANKINKSWKTKFFSSVKFDKLDILLTTDGISEDIIKGKEELLLRELIHKAAFKKKNTAKNILKHFKEHEIPKYAGDDKTLAVYAFRK